MTCHHVHVLWVYSIYNNCWDQVKGFQETMQLRAVSISWLKRPVTKFLEIWEQIVAAESWQEPNETICAHSKLDRLYQSC